jgi:hypothetical protein
MSIRSLHFDEEEITRQKNVFLVQMSYSAKKTEKDRKRQKKAEEDAVEKIEKVEN